MIGNAIPSRNQKKRYVFSSTAKLSLSMFLLPFELNPLAMRVKGKIDLSTVLDPPPQEVSPADALGNRARGLERELKGPGATQKEE